MTWERFQEFSGREFLKFVLRVTHGNVSEAARILELERAYLHRLMKKLGIQRDVAIK
jgi:transcriptional regulator with GAF, ATPase, and Fis domain